MGQIFASILASFPISVARETRQMRQETSKASLLSVRRLAQSHVTICEEFAYAPRIQLFRVALAVNLKADTF